MFKVVEVGFLDVEISALCLPDCFISGFVCVCPDFRMSVSWISCFSVYGLRIHGVVDSCIGCICEFLDLGFCMSSRSSHSGFLDFWAL